MASISSLDIDIDINGSRKHFILDRLRQFFGEDRVLQVCTFSTDSSKSAIQTACRGMGISDDIGRHISSLIPNSRGSDQTIAQCLWGDEKEGLKPVPSFIREIEKYPNLAETALKIEGLIKGRSVHAGGVLILNDHYTKNNALMKSPKGVPTTQYNLKDSQSAGGLKFDLLVTDATEKLQVAMDYLIEAGEIEKQETLRKTYEKYLRPQVIDLKNPKYFELMGKAEVPDLFQFSTDIMKEALKASKPSTLVEAMGVNSIVRLTTASVEQPIDTFVKYRFNIDLWYEEMKSYGLSEKEIEIMEDHLKPINGVADTQESAMGLAMDKRITGFTMQEATDLRKAMAAKNPEVADGVKELFYQKGRALKTSENLLDYVWGLQIWRMLGYAFSNPHVLAYTLIAFQQLHIYSHYSPIYWQTAVLTVNSGSQEVEDGGQKKGRDYGRTGKAISDFQALGVKISPPFINSSDFGFVPDEKNNRIIYSLKGVSRMNDEVVDEIRANRPYASFEDFYERMFLTKKIQKQQLVNLIKAGAFGEFEEPIETMKKFIFKVVNPKDKLTRSNFSKMIEYGAYKEEDLKFMQVFELREYIKKCKKDGKNYIVENNEAKELFVKLFPIDLIVGYKDRDYIVEWKGVDNYYKTFTEPFVEKLKEDDWYLNKFNTSIFMEEWNKSANGTVESWEMEAMAFYSDKHDLDRVDFERYGFAKYSELPKEPLVTSTYEWSGRTMENYQLHTIIGTVLDKNKSKRTFTLLTPHGVVVCRAFGRFSHYDRQIKQDGKILELSWFTRGNQLMVTGFRRGDQFFLKAPKNEHTVQLITQVQEGGEISLQAERAL